MPGLKPNNRTLTPSSDGTSSFIIYTSSNPLTYAADDNRQKVYKVFEHKAGKNLFSGALKYQTSSASVLEDFCLYRVL